MEKYTLIVTEKPDAAQRIAEALDLKGRPKKGQEKKVQYFIADRDQLLMVVPALGHLYNIVNEKGPRSTYPVFNFKWAPRYLVEKGAGKIKACIEAFSKLSQRAIDFVDACDYDIEGALIGYTILKYACNNKEKEAKRMKYSTLAKGELEKSYEERMPHLDFAMIEAGKTRHEVDWLYGVNISRALTIAAKRSSGQYATLSTGRVQGPTLKFLVARERNINSFVPTPYWSILAEVEIQDSKYLVDYEKKIIEKRADADAVVEDCKGKDGQIEAFEDKIAKVMAPIPFDLGLLQSEAYRLFRYTPYRTGYIAQRLYLDALISYPRTSSQKLPPSINYRSILRGLGGCPSYERLVTELLEQDCLKPAEGKKTDPAHPAIYPTGNLPKRLLRVAERRIWDLIVRRFMAVFGEPAVKQSMKAAITVNGHRFHLRGKRIMTKGWMQFYKPYLHNEEFSLPPIKRGESVCMTQISREDKFTKSPPRYNPSSLLKRMEKEGIGTKATRANIIETLYKRKYITGERIIVTELGFSMIEVLHEHASSIISVKLTRDLEAKMSRIQSGEEKRENALSEAIEHLKPVLAKMKQQEQIIGEELVDAIKSAKMQERIICECPNCQIGRLVIIFSRRTKKRFIGCTNYFKNTCQTSFPLPQHGVIKLSGKTCEGCGLPLLLIHIRGKRPWSLCFNPKCPKKEEKES
jgi:DNA topoisomerase-1